MKSSIVRTLSCAPPCSYWRPRCSMAGQLEGVPLADTVKAGEKMLKLNGLGLRKKAVFKVYVGGLYLETPSKDSGAILASDQAKAIRLHFLRDLTKAQLVEAFQEGFDANAKEAAAQKAAFDKMLALVPDVKTGSTLTFTYLPGKGTTCKSRTRSWASSKARGSPTRSSRSGWAPSRLLRT